MKKAETSEAFIISEDYQFLGKIYLSSIIGKNPSTKIENLVEKDVIFIHSNASLQQAIEIAANFVGETIPIIEPFENKYVGSVSEGDIFSAYLDFQNQILDLEKK